MIMYNTLTGFCAAVVILIAADLVRRIHRGETSPFPGHAVVLLITGTPLTILSGIGAATWPLNVNPPVNIAFWEPSVMLGLLAIAGGILLLLRLPGLGDYRAIGWFVFALGLMLGWITSGVWSYNLIGNAPAAEPITGQFTGWENFTFGALYLLIAIGCLAAPWFHTKPGAFVMRWAWTISGAALLLFALLNYRTHIGMLINLTTGSHYRW